MPSPTEQELAAAASLAAKELLKEMRGVTTNDHLSSPFTPHKVERNTNPGRTRRLPAGMSPVTAYVRSLDGDYHTTQEVADELGVSAQLIRKLARLRVTQAPSFVAPFGQTRVNLYTPEDIEALRTHLAGRRQVFRRDDLGPLPEPPALKDARENE